MTTSFVSVLGMILLLLLILGGIAIVVSLAVLAAISLSNRRKRDTSPAAPPVLPGSAVSPGWCSRCEAPMPVESPQGLCPRCVMRVGLATETEAGPQGTKIVPPAESEVARRFPHLEILGCLGQGGMGVVYKARQPKLNRTVALKILTPEKGADPRFAERFQREAQALARLSHPNIIAVHDYGEADGMFFLLMEYVDGMNLRQLLREGRLQPGEALAIVPPICEALQFAHEQGVVHRDIKPENVLLDKDGRVKIADFGIAKLLAQPGGEAQASLTQDQVIGTPHYMAPEQVEHPGTVDHRADIYSLGVVFYELLTGELPLGKFQPPSRKVQVDVRLDEVVLRALEKEPDRRYQKAREIKTDVETISGSAAVMPATQVPASGQPGAAKSGFLHTPAGKLGFAALALVILIGLGVWLAAPKHPYYVLTGRVVDGTTRDGMSHATITVSRIHEGKVVRQAAADTNGNYRVEWDDDADLLYWKNGIRYGVELAVSARAPGYEEQTVSLSDTHDAGYYRRTLNFRLKRLPDGVVSGAEPTRKFVRLYVHGDDVRFQGNITSWGAVPQLLETVPDRGHTVLELAVGSDEITVAAQNELVNRVNSLARQYGFEYASFVGVQEKERAQAEPQPAAFGPDRELTISGRGDTRRGFVDLDTGRLYAASEFFGPKEEPSPERTQEWLEQTGIDAVGDIRPSVYGLVGFSLMAVPVERDHWDMSPGQISYYLPANLTNMPVPMHLSGKGELPATFAIQTREGARGLLQLSSVTTNPPEVKIRYKLLQKTTGMQ